MFLEQVTPICIIYPLNLTNYPFQVSAADIADMSLPELQKMLRCEDLTDEQKTLIRKIRRTGEILRSDEDYSWL